MEFTVRTLVVLVLLLIVLLVVIALSQTWTGKSINIVDGIRDFFKNLLGLS